MKTKTIQTFEINIFISGPLAAIEDVCRAEMRREDYCVTVTPTRFVFGGGDQEGARVGLLSYPRKPCPDAVLRNRAEKLARELLDGLHQNTALIVDPDTTTWISVAEEPGGGE